MSVPALRCLRRHLPAAEITLLTPAKLAGLWCEQPFLDRVISFDHQEKLPALATRLRAERFELALVFPNSTRSALEVWGAGIPLRIGYARTWRRVWLTHAVKPRVEARPMRKPSRAEVQRRLQDPTRTAPLRNLPRAAHHLFHYLELLRPLGIPPEPEPPRLEVGQESRRRLNERWPGLSLPPASVAFRLGLNPGAEYGPAKRWPAEAFLETALEVRRRHPVQWILFGGKADVSLAQQLVDEINRPSARRPPAINLAGQTSLGELLAALETCRCLLTNDTGPMHAAAAVGTPVVVPFGSTSPGLTGPGLPGTSVHRVIQADTPCAPCFLRQCPIDLRCLKAIRPETVARTIEDLLAH